MTMQTMTDLAPKLPSPGEVRTSQATAQPDRRPHRVSIIITNHNYERYVGDAIKSALAQSHPDIECIVVDDGSTDGSRATISRFSGITAVFQGNAGQAHAARAGLARSTGGIVVFLDADDMLLPHACAEIAARWTPGTAAVLGRLKVMREGKATPEILPHEPFASAEPAAFVRHHGFLPSAPMSGNAYARTAVERILATGLKLDKHGLDAWLTLCAPYLGNIATIDAPIGVYRIHGANISLAATRTLRRIKARLYYQYWAQRSAARFDARRAEASWEFLKGPYNLKWYVLTKHLADTEFDIPEERLLPCVAECCREFLTFPGISPLRRIGNCATVVALACLPAPLKTTVLRRVYGLDV